MGDLEDQLSASRTQGWWAASAQRNMRLGTNLYGYMKVRADVFTLTCRHMQRAKNGMSVIARTVIEAC